MANVSQISVKSQKLPSLVVTGATGFIGRYFLQSAINNFRVFCIARRSQNEANIAPNKNIFWYQADIANANSIKTITQNIKDHGGADYIVHLAGYYDFSLKDRPEYQKTNVIGTLNILNLSKDLRIKRFIFASSLAACRFSDNYNSVVDESSPVDAEYPYAISKRKAEEMIREYSSKFSCSIIRLAAVFSDWCEYPPLYKFLETWLSHKWNARVLGGNGEASITYVHIQDLVKLILRIIEISYKLPDFGIYLASPGGTVSHKDLFKASTKFYFGKSPAPIKIPKLIAVPGVIARSALGKITGNVPFEKYWMTKYIDKKLIVENADTCKELDWKPSRRLDILRRLTRMIENLKNNQFEWTIKNEAALNKIAYRANIAIHDQLLDSQNFLVNKIVDFLSQHTPENKFRFPNFGKTRKIELKEIVTLFYQLIAHAIKTKERDLLKNYTKLFTHKWFVQRYEIHEINDFYHMIGIIIKDEIASTVNLKISKQEANNFLDMIIQLTIDEAEDYYEFLRSEDLNTENKSEQSTIIHDEQLLLFLKQMSITTDLLEVGLPKLLDDLNKNF